MRARVLLYSFSLAHRLVISLSANVYPPRVTEPSLLRNGQGGNPSLNLCGMNSLWSGGRRMTSKGRLKSSSRPKKGQRVHESDFRALGLVVTSHFRSRRGELLSRLDLYQVSHFRARWSLRGRCHGGQLFPCVGRSAIPRAYLLSRCPVK